MPAEKPAATTSSWPLDASGIASWPGLLHE
jgi:hypothetical protein